MYGQYDLKNDEDNIMEDVEYYLHNGSTTRCESIHQLNEEAYPDKA